MSVAAAAVLALVAQPAQAQDAAKGAALMAEARKALGGEEKIAAIKRLQANGEFRRAQGNQTAEGDFELMIEAPDKYLLKEESGNAGGPISERTQALNGTEVWDDNATAGPGGGFGGGGGRGFGGGGGPGGPGGDGGGGGFPGGRPGGAGNGGAANGGAAAPGGAPAFDPERIREQQRRTRQADLARWLLVSLMTTDAPVAWIGTAESPDGSKADVIEVKPADGQATRVFLDTATHMPLMLTYDGPAGRQGGAGGGARRGGGFGRGGDAGAAPQGGQGAAQGGQGPAAAPAAGAAAPAGQAAAPAGGPGAPGAQGGRRGGGGAAGVPTTIEMHLEQYKAVNGIKLPFHITRGINGQTSEELTVKSYKLNPNFKANTFTKK